jgi:selenoprotein W-related protein
LTAELLKEFEPGIAEITLIPSDGGCYEVAVDGKLVYSKLQTGRHAEPGEVVKLIKNLLAGRG